jgi:Spy/CpxP family protein refolding chaperone
MEMESNMLKKLLGAAAMAAVALALVPAHAAKMGGGCSGANMAKTETMIECMADGEGKMMAQKELSTAQDAMLGGKMGACGMHLSKAMHAGMSK